MLEDLVIDVYPFVYAKNLLIHFSIKSKSGLVRQYIEQTVEAMYNGPNTTKASRNFNMLAYCYCQIGLTNEAIYYNLFSMRCFSCGKILLCFTLLFFILNGVNKAKAEAVKHTWHQNIWMVNCDFIFTRYLPRKYRMYRFKAPNKCSLQHGKG